MAVAAYLFQPWLLLLDRRVDEAAPAAVSAPEPPIPTSAPAAARHGSAGSWPPPADESAPRVLS